MNDCAGATVINITKLLDDKLMYLQYYKTF